MLSKTGRHEGKEGEGERGMRELEKEIEGGGGDRRERHEKVRKVGGRIIRERKNGEKRVIRGLKKEKEKYVRKTKPERESERGKERERERYLQEPTRVEKHIINFVSVSHFIQGSVSRTCQ